MPSSFTPSEALKDETCAAFAGARTKDGWVCAWAHRRRGWGADLVVQRPTSRQEVLVARADSVGWPVFSPDGAELLVVVDNVLKLCDCEKGETETLYAPPDGEKLKGAPRWSDGAVFFVVAAKGGRETLKQLHRAGEYVPEAFAEDVFVASAGGSIGSFDKAPDEPFRVAVTHRLADAMVAEVLVVDLLTRKATCMARDARVEYAAPSLGYLHDGRLLCRFGGLCADLDGAPPCFAEDPAAYVDLADGPAANLAHGLFALGDDGCWEAVPLFDRADVAARSYGPAPAPRDLVLDAARRRAIVTARPAVANSVGEALYLVSFRDDGTSACDRLRGGAAATHAVALSDDRYLFVLRTPSSWGDLYERYVDNEFSVCQLTKTMPITLSAKAARPDEIRIDDGSHALVYWPPTVGDAVRKVQAVVWGHGGPLCSHAIEYYPLFNWLADQGYAVVVPHFPGSVGFGLEFMDAVRGDGCGRADHAGMVAAGRFVLAGGLRPPSGLVVDVSRGVAAAGHSWGGYLGLLAATRADTPFSCVVASSGLADWAIQQKRTEVRYYDRWLMGGWVYKPEVAARAKAANPDPATLRMPLLLCHGKADTDCPFSQIETFAKRVAPPATGEPLLETLFFEGEGHSPSGWSAEHRKAWFGAVAKFLKTHLQPWNFTDNPHGEVTAY